MANPYTYVTGSNLRSTRARVNRFFRALDRGINPRDPDDSLLIVGRASVPVIFEGGRHCPPSSREPKSGKGCPVPDLSRGYSSWDVLGFLRSASMTVRRAGQMVLNSPAFCAGSPASLLLTSAFSRVLSLGLVPCL